MRRFTSLLLITCVVSLANAQDERIPPGQQRMEVLSGFVGTWRGTDNKGKETTTTYKWINNKSFIEMIVGDYREIVGWDLTDEQIVSWGFGTHGGQGKVIWEQEGENTWSRKSNWLDRWGKEVLVTSKVVLKGDEMQWSFRYGENDPATSQSKRVTD